MEKVKERKTVYVVTRNGRRVEPQNYSEEAGAQDRAEKLVKTLKQHSPMCVKNVRIIKTKNPNTIC